MVRALVALVGTASVAAAIDLAYKAGADGAMLHERSPTYVVVVLTGSVLWAAAILLTRSVAMAAAGGLLLGGAAGNLLSLAFWPGVPNPIVVSPIAFNLADTFVVVGFGLVCATALGLAASNKDALGQPIHVRAAPNGTRSR
jgi:lipoprotein signal peptidase